MLWTIFVILLVLWLLGMVTSYTLGGFIHILLVIAVVVILIRIIGFFAPRLEKVYSRLIPPRPVEPGVELTPARFHAY